MYSFSVTEEPLSNLTPDMILYRASEAHNLAMISHSLALGANKNWHNPDDNGQTPLHQAVASVSMQTLVHNDINFRVQLSLNIHEYNILGFEYSQGSCKGWVH